MYLTDTWNGIAPKGVRPFLTKQLQPHGYTPRLSFKTEFWIKMKLTGFLLFAVCMAASAKGFTQQVTLHLKNAGLQQAFRQIKQQSGYSFVYAEDLLQKAHPVNIAVTNEPVTAAIKKCMAGQPFTYTIIDKVVVINTKNMVADDTPVVDTVPLYSPLPPPLDIRGLVKNEAGEPLAGASVQAVKTNKGTITNAAGSFVIKGVALNDKIKVSYVGYTAKTVTIENSNEIVITLKIADNKLDEMVVQAYGTTSHRLHTGNISRITAKDIEKQPVMNVLNVLQGQTPGVDVVNTTGYASGVVKVEIRGRNLINTGFSSDPLYVVDGVPLTIQDLKGMDTYQGGSVGVSQAGVLGPSNGQSPIFNINPNDIESIEVLKDADATAIYGSRGANGVILITTKQGKPGKIKTELNASTGFTTITRFYDMMNTAQYLAMRREALQNDGVEINVVNAPEIMMWDTTRNTNWQKALMSGGTATTANATVSGGSSFSTFRISADYSRQKDLSTYSGANQRASVSANFMQQSANRKFRMQLSTFYTVTKTDLKHMPNLSQLPPHAPAIFKEDGSPNYSGWAPLDNLYRFGNLINPFESTTNFFNASLTPRYKIVKGLEFIANLGFGKIENDQFRASRILSANPNRNALGDNTFTHTFSVNQIIEPQLEYNVFLLKGKLTILSGASWQNNVTASTYQAGRNYTNDAFLESVTNAPMRETGNDKGVYKYIAGFGRLTYNLYDKYIINLNARRDGSSKFGPGRQFGNFGSVGAAWIFAEEAFVKKILPFLSFGKLRGSHGTTGGDAIGNYQYISRWIFGNTSSAYNGIMPLNPVSHLDSMIQWQVNHKTEVAINLGFLKDRIFFDFSWYRNRCDNQLTNFPTPIYTGFRDVLTNSPANVENKGWELVIKGKAIQSLHFNWEVQANISRNVNRLLSYPNLEQSPYYGKLQVGKPLNITRVLEYDGVDPQTGDYSFVDRNKNGTIETNKPGEDDTYYFNLTPAFFGGLTNSLHYKGWDLSIFFYFKKGYGRNAFASLSYAGGINNQPAIVLNRWQKPGDITDIPRFTNNAPSILSSRYKMSDAVYTDASFIRLQNITLSYRLKESICNKLNISGLRAFVKAHNLFIISNYNGLDPEVQDYTSPPRPFIFTTGFSFNF